MSRLTVSRRYAVAGYSDTEREQLIGHLIASTQPQRRIFLGKTEGFNNKEERKIHQKMLKAYLKGNQLFYHSKTEREIIHYKFNIKTGKKDIPVHSGVFEEVPKANLVRQMYFFN